MRYMHVQAHLVLFLFLSSSVSSKATILEDACKDVAAKNNEGFVVSYDYCIKFFQANKGSATADKVGLAIIAMNITRVAAHNVGERIAALQASEKGISIQQWLQDCAEDYSLAVDRLGEAMNYTASSVLKKGDAQKSLLLAAGQDLNSVAFSTCEFSFNESLLSAENSEFLKKALIALAVIPSQLN